MMKEKSVLLSISMLVSGKKEEEMEKSLNSLHFFKDAIPCEVILVDTGCSKEQRAFIEKYADKVVDFAWCNDFAAARNAGLKEAKGEWFMYLDDDEWFEDPQEIISFFQTGEYKNYHCASYVVRNYRDMQGVMYDESYPSRLVEMRPETKFVGKVHEYLEPFILPKKAFSDFVHHYGYVYKDDEDRAKHTLRNVEPLLEMIKEEPGDPRWTCQLAQEYFSDFQYEKTIEVCEEGIERWKLYKDKVNYAPSHVGALYAYILVSLETEKRFEEQEPWYERAIEETPYLEMIPMIPTRAFYSLVAARMYFQLKKYEQSSEQLRIYIDYLKKYGEDRTLVEAGTAAVVEGVFQEQLVYGTVLMCTESAIRMEDTELVEEAFYLLDWMNDRRLLQQSQWERGMLEGCCSVDYHPTWSKILQTLVARPDGMKEMQVVFLETEIAFKQEGDLEKLYRLNRLVAELDFEHFYILTKKIVWAEKDPKIATVEERREKVAELLDRLFDKYVEEIFDVRPEVWDVMGRLGMSLESYFLQVDFNRFRRVVEVWYRQTNLQMLQQWEERMANGKTQEDIRYQFFEMKCLEGYLIHYREICSSLLQISSLLWKYADSVIAFYEPHYREEVFRGMQEVLPEEVQLALRLKELQKYHENGDILKSLECVRRLLGVCLFLEPLIEDYAKQYRDDVDRRNKGVADERAELMRLVRTLKQTAKVRMDKQDYEGAKEILLQVNQCVPDDEEVKTLLQRIETQG